MKRLIDVDYKEANEYFLKGSSYFNNDIPKYISFEHILNDVWFELLDKNLSEYYKNKEKPSRFSDVNYRFLANKDGRFSWRPFELIHPAIYISLVRLICEPQNWEIITKRLKSFDDGVVVCCSSPVLTSNGQSDKARQVEVLWQKVEQESIKLSLDFCHLIHTDVTDCYGSLYTHSIAWAIHGYEEAKIINLTKFFLVIRLMSLSVLDDMDKQQESRKALS